MHSHIDKLLVLGVWMVVEWTYNEYASQLIQIDGIKLLNPDQDLTELFQCRDIFGAVESSVHEYENHRRLS